MGLKKNRRFQKFVILVGSMLLALPGGVDWYWGNMSVYVLSYVVMQGQPAATVQVPWIISLYNCFLALGFIISGFNSIFLPRRWLVLIGVVITDVAIFSSYFAIQLSYSMTILNITVGVFVGIGSGLVYGNVIALVVEFSDLEEVGFATSIVMCSLPAGALVITQFTTWYVNPLNLAPNLRYGSTNYFNQKDIVDKVPGMFVVLGVFTLTLQLVGLTLVQIDASMRYFNCHRVNEHSEEYSLSHFLLNENNSSSRLTNSTSCNRSTTTTTTSTTNSEIQVHPNFSPNPPEEDGAAKLTRSTSDVMPKELLQMPVFYALWISYAGADVVFDLLVNYYKLYGQIWIKDDHFLTHLGTFCVFFTCLSRIMWGKTMDKFGPKLCLMALNSGTVLCVIWFYFTARLHRWVYAMVTLSFGCFAGALHCCYVIAMPLVFGKTRVSTKIGLITTGTIVANIVFPKIFNAILTNFGWFATFALGGFANVFSLILCVIFVS